MLKTKSIEVASSVQSPEHQPIDHIISSVSYARKVSHMHAYGYDMNSTDKTHKSTPHASPHCKNYHVSFTQVV